MTIAVARFSNESTYGAGLFADQYGDRLGKQASDLLTNHLVETQRFSVVERPDLGRLQRRQADGPVRRGLQKEPKGVDALILGSVAELGRETTGSSWFVGRSKQQRARARVVLRWSIPVRGKSSTHRKGAVRRRSKHPVPRLPRQGRMGLHPRRQGDRRRNRGHDEQRRSNSRCAPVDEGRGSMSVTERHARPADGCDLRRSTKRQSRSTTAVLRCVLLSACAAPALRLGELRKGLQDSYISDDEAQTCSDLEAAVTTVQQTGRCIPPGAGAEYGFSLYRRGQRKAAIEHLQREAQLFPSPSR